MSFLDKFFRGGDAPRSKEMKKDKTDLELFVENISAKVEELGGRMTAEGNEERIIGLYLPTDKMEEMQSYLESMGYTRWISETGEGVEEYMGAYPESGQYVSFESFDRGTAKKETEAMFRIGYKSKY